MGCSSAKPPSVTSVCNQGAEACASPLPALEATTTAQPLLRLSPGDDLQAEVDSQPEGTTFEIEAGIHRLKQPIVPKAGDSFIGEPGATLSGAKLLVGFRQEGRLWNADAGLTSPGTIHGECDDSSDTACQYPQDLFIDNIIRRRITDPALGAPGSWYLDYEANRVYIWEDPTGRNVELSVTPHAFFGTVDDVTIRGLIIEKFATPAQRGAIHARNEENGSLGANWVVEHNEIRQNHGGGIRLGAAMQVRYNQIHHNGQIGIVGGESKDILIEGNEIAFNNTAGFSGYWEAGGTKFSYTEDLVVRANYVHDNVGPGLWTDIDNVNTLYEHNNVESNTLIGIQHEISYSAVIRNNLVQYNGAVIYDYLWGAQIMVSGSSDVEIYDNTVLIPWGGQGIGVIQDARLEYRTRNVYVHHNQIIGLGRTGADENPTDLEMYDTVLFDYNTYYETNRWFWNGEVSFEQFQAAGQEANGVVIEERPQDSILAAP